MPETVRERPRSLAPTEGPQWTPFWQKTADWERFDAEPTGDRAMLRRPDVFYVEAGATQAQTFGVFLVWSVPEESQTVPVPDAKLEASFDHISRIMDILPGDAAADRRLEQWFKRLTGPRTRATPLKHS